MRFSKLIFLPLILSFLCLLFFQNPIQAQTPEEIQKIENAAPEKATVTPKKPRKLLVVSICHGFKHKCIPIAAKAIEILGKKTGAYEVVHAKDLSVFEWDNLKQYDGVLFNNTTKLKFDNEKWRKNLLKFIKNGKGVIGIHAATDNFYDWPEGAEMMGGLFDGHPWNSKGTWKVKIDEPDHPLNAAFEGKDFEVNDEIYRTKGFTREKLRVLVSLDMADEVNLSAKGVKYTDKDIPISWIRRYGKGRLFYCSFGHNNHIYWTPSILRHYLDGIQYALGDYPVDDTPSVDKYMEDAAKYQWGQSRASLTMLSDFVRWAIDHPDVRARTEERFIKFLKRKDASLPGKQFVCRQLSLIGTEKSVPVLVSLLRKEKTSNMARYALERIPGEKVDVELLKALKKTRGLVRIGIVNTLGVRRYAKALSELKKLVYDKDAEVASAAVAAIGRIGGDQAVKILAEAKNKLSGKLRNQVLDAYLACADQYLNKGKSTAANKIYRELYQPKEPVPVRASALRGLILSDLQNGVQTIKEVLQGDDTELQAVAISMIRELPESTDVREIAELLPDLPLEGQIQLLSALADRGDSAARMVVLKATESPEAEVRIAALRALAVLGNSRDVKLLASKAASSRGKESQIARESLYRLSGPDIDDTILKTIPDVEPAVKVELIRSLAERGVTKGVDLLFTTAKDEDSKVRVESLKSLGVLAAPGRLSELIQLLLQAQTDTERREAERAVYAVTQKIPPKGGKAEAILAVLPIVKDETSRGSLLQVLGRIGDRKALGILRKSLKSKSDVIKTAAIRALTDWPTPEPAEDLLEVAKTSKNKVHQVLALRGYIRLVDVMHTHPASVTLKMYKTAMELATEANEKRMVLSALANVQSVEALNWAMNYLNDPLLKGEAQAAAVRIAREIYRSYPDECKKAMEKILTTNPSEQVKNNAERVLRYIQEL